MAIQKIHDLSDPVLAPYADLTRRQLAGQDLFIAESGNVIASALDAGLVPVSLLGEERHLLGKAAGLVERLSGIPVYTAADEQLKKLTGYELSRGVLCAFRRPEKLSPLQALQKAACCAVLENVRDAANLGAIFRSAAALGIDAVLMTPGCTDVLSRRSVRVSMGAVFRLPWAEIAELNEGGLEILKEAGFTPCALALTEKSEDIRALASVQRPALLLGNEGDGLKPETVEASERVFRIPMRRGVDSLNVAAAAAVAFWNVTRN